MPALLAAVGLGLPDDLGRLGDWPVDDVLDATVAAWTAAGPALGAPLISHPADPPRDADRPIAIWTRPRPTALTTPWTRWTNVGRLIVEVSPRDDHRHPLHAPEGHGWRASGRPVVCGREDPERRQR